MHAEELKAVLNRHFAPQGYTVAPEANLALDLVLSKPGQDWGLALGPDMHTGMAYLGAFETGMQRLLDARRTSQDLLLGLGLAFGSTAAGSPDSYRPALKKYSNSIVFEDVGISVFLIKEEDDVIVLAPDEVNPFLRDLNRWIAAQRGDRLA